MDFDFEEVIRIFQVEAAEGLTAMEQGLVALEGRPDDPELLGMLFRHAHTLKGNAASLGFGAVAEVTHVLEDLLDRYRQPGATMTAEVVTLLLRTVDHLRLLMQQAAAERDTPPPEQGELLIALRQAAVGPAMVGPAMVDGSPGAFAANRPPGEEAGVPVFDLLRSHGLRVGLDKLDRLLTLAGEIAVARGRIGSLLEQLGEPGRQAREAHEDAQRLDRELQELVTRVRMVPLGPSFRQQIRTVRDVATASGKKVRLVVEGEEVEADLEVVERLHDPLTHMIRNALDHGVESPAKRLAAGKGAVATITLRARYQASQVVVEVEDDGAGLDRAAILERARERGLVAADQDLAAEEIDRLIFAPGLTTAERVTELSGRGVGMDVVRRNVEELRGTVEVASTAGEGTRLAIRLPLTLAIIQAFLVEAGEEVYALPLDAVAECVELPAARRNHEKAGGEAGIANLRGEALPYLRLKGLFEVGDGGDAGEATRETLVVLRDTGQRAGVVVDRPRGQTQAVIKPLPRLVAKAPGIIGTTILGDGSVALILDVGVLLREAVTRARSGDA